MAARGSEALEIANPLALAMGESRTRAGPDNLVAQGAGPRGWQPTLNARLTRAWPAEAVVKRQLDLEQQKPLRLTVLNGLPPVAETNTLGWKYVQIIIRLKGGVCTPESLGLDDRFCTLAESTSSFDITLFPCFGSRFPDFRLDPNRFLSSSHHAPSPVYRGSVPCILADIEFFNLPSFGAVGDVSSNPTYVVGSVVEFAGTRGGEGNKRH